jgi:Ca-activated chloride channel family protein
MGQTSEVAIRRLATEGNPFNRRIFTFGVGVDVNTPLLDKIATETRATATFVLPKEDVEVKVAKVFSRLSGPVLAEPELEVIDANGKPDPGRVRDVIPGKLPDLFKGDQLVILGQYLGEQPLCFRLTGNYLGRKRIFEFKFGLKRATTRNAFVPRLWASRRIGILLEAVRQLGADVNPIQADARTALDPKVNELVEEILRMSVEFGILTEYTAFLAREGSPISGHNQILAEAQRNVQRRAAYGPRWGNGSYNQFSNLSQQRAQRTSNRRNRYLDENLNRVEVTSVQQISDRAFYKRGETWVDSRLVEKEEVKPKRTIEFGSKEFVELLDMLAKNGRQGSVALGGDILLVIDGEPVLIKGPEGK